MMKPFIFLAAMLISTGTYAAEAQKAPSDMSRAELTQDMAKLSQQLIDAGPGASRETLEPTCSRLRQEARIIAEDAKKTSGSAMPPIGSGRCQELGLW